MWIMIMIFFGGMVVGACVGVLVMGVFCGAKVNDAMPEQDLDVWERDGQWFVSDECRPRPKRQ